jgi:DNA-directed RNA polymerase alpha subunit
MKKLIKEKSFKDIDSYKEFDIKSLFQPIESLGLTIRSINCLTVNNIFFIGDLIQYNKNTLSQIPGFGIKSLNEIINALAKQGLSLGMTVKGWYKKEKNINE